MYVIDVLRSFFLSNYTFLLYFLCIGPICRYPLSQKNEYNVSYSLEEACRLFQAIKHHSDNSKIKFPKATVRTEQTVEKRPRPKDGNQVPNDTHGGLKNEDNKRHSAILSFILASSPSPKGKPSQGQQQTKHHDYTFNNTTSYYCTCSSKYYRINKFIFNSISFLFHRSTTILYIRSI